MPLLRKSSAVCAVVLTTGLGSTVSFAQPPAERNTNQRDCLQAAKAVLGPEGAVMRCGDLNGDGGLEAVIALRRTPPHKKCASVSRLFILRRNGTAWRQVLEAAPNFIKNEVGYVGTDYIDDSDPPFSVGFCVSVYDRNPGTPNEPFGLSLQFIGSGDRVDEEALPLSIDWNAKVRRFQEVMPNGDLPIAFAAEKKSVPHIDLRRRLSQSSPVKQ